MLQSTIANHQAYFQLGFFTRRMESSNNVESYIAGEVIEAGHPVKVVDHKLVNIVAADVQKNMGILLTKVSMSSTKPVSCAVGEQCDVACTGYVAVKVAVTTGLDYGVTAQYNPTTKIWAHVSSVTDSKYIFTGKVDVESKLAEVKILEGFAR